MIVMASNCTGVFWHCLARETGLIGHLYSPNAQRGPWPWLPYGLDSGCFSLWDQEENRFNEEEWLAKGLPDYLKLLGWASLNRVRPRFAIVPDRPGDWQETVRKWEVYAPDILETGFSLGVAVQDGADEHSVLALEPRPDVICIGGTTAWKWETAKAWASSFPRVHLLRNNSPARLEELDSYGFESCDGTGWARGTLSQSEGLEAWARRCSPGPYKGPLWPYLLRNEKKGSASNGQRILGLGDTPKGSIRMTV